MWLCRSPRMSPSSISAGQPRRAGRGLAARLGSPAAPARCRPARAARTPRLGRAVVRLAPVASSRTPYSETCRPRAHRASRSAALCAPGAGEVLQQVAELARARRCAGPRRFRMGACARAGVACGAHALDLLERRRARRAAPVGASTATMSRSLTLSARRRAEPGELDARAGPSARSAARSASPISSARVSSEASRAARRDRSPRSERGEHRCLELRPEALHRCEAAVPWRPRAGRRASRCRARRTAAARAWGRARAAA